MKNWFIRYFSFFKRIVGCLLVAEKDGSRFFVQEHPEYDPDTLDKEYHRDLAKGGDCVMPKNYYKKWWCQWYLLILCPVYLE